MPSSKYLKNSLSFDLIYRSTLFKNPLDLPYIKKSSFITSNTSSLPNTIASINALKILSCSAFARSTIKLSTSSVNELSIKKGDPVSCTMTLSRNSTLALLDSYPSTFSSVPAISPISLNLNQAVASFPLTNLRYFYPYSFYESCLLVPSNALFLFSIHFSRPLSLDSISLLSAFFPLYGSKKKVNSFRNILREMEQSG
jgi:hypothetical protein